MPTYISELTAAAPIANGTAINGTNEKGATVAVAGYSNPVFLGGSTAPYIAGYIGPALPTTGQLWPPIS